MGKARVTPLKIITIPCLELTAAVLAIHVDRMLNRELKLQLQESDFWTDSTSVLKYIKNEDTHFHTFVANRVSTIREVTTLPNGDTSAPRKTLRMMRPGECKFFFQSL